MSCQKSKLLNYASTWVLPQSSLLYFIQNWKEILFCKYALKYNLKNLLNWFYFSEVINEPSRRKWWLKRKNGSYFNFRARYITLILASFILFSNTNEQRRKEMCNFRVIYVIFSSAHLRKQIKPTELKPHFFK